MKFSSEVKSLRSAVKTVGVSVQRKNTIPILDTIHMSASSKTSTVVLRGTDLDVEINLATPAEVDTDGAVCVDAHLVESILNKLPTNSRVTFELDTKKGIVVLKCGRSRFKLMTLPPEGFPSFKEFSGKHRFTMSGADLTKLIESTQFAVSTEAARYYLNGIYLHHTNGATLQVTATDGHRLAWASVEMPTGAEGMPNVIIPNQTVNYLQRSIDGVDNVEIAVSQATIEMVIGDITLKSKLIDAQFLDYQRVVPTNNDKLAKINVAAFIDAAERVTAISLDRGRAVKLDFEPGLVKFSVSNPDTGSSEDELEIEWTAEESLTIGFNSKYLCEVLNRIGTETAEIRLKNAGSPTLFKSIDDDSRFFILMPLRI
jgi:DNA polymerase III subunit beta